MRRLLVLDINGVLCRKYRQPPPVKSKLKIIKLPSYKVVFRPGYKEFLKFCYQHYDIGYFSSTSPINAGKILYKMLTVDQRNANVFEWFRDRTRIDPEDLHEEYPRTIKNLTDIFTHPYINATNIYHRANTLICDDSPSKVRFNNPLNVILTQPFDGDPDDNILFELMQRLPVEFDKISNRKY